MSVVTIEFFRAAALGDLNRLRALLAHGVDINSTNRANQTALMLAAAFGQTEIVKFLLASGADVNCQDEMGLTAADWGQQQEAIVELLNSAEQAHGIHLTQDVKPVPLPEEPQPASSKADDTSRSDFGSAILRANQRHAQSHASESAATLDTRAVVTSEAPIVADDETVDSPKRKPSEPIDDTVATAAPAQRAAPKIAGDSSKAAADRVDIPIPPPQPVSAAMRALFRVTIVLLLLVGGFVTYHVGSLILGNRNTETVDAPAPAVPVEAATTITKAPPLVGGDLAGAELFLSDAAYPADATVASGKVTVNVQVSAKGIVLSAKAIDGDESLRAAAEKAAKGSAFAPDKLQSGSSRVNGTIVYTFLKADRAQQVAEVGSLQDASDVSVIPGGPIAAAANKLTVPIIPNRVRVEKQSITVVVRVGKSGKVLSWRPLDGNSRLRPYLIKAARSSTFDPNKLPGDRDVVGFITYKFE